MKAINNRYARQASMIRKLSPTRRVVTTRLRRRQAGPLRCVRIVIICVALGCLLSLLYRDAVQAADAEPTSLQQLAKTLEGEQLQSSAHLFYRYPLGFDVQTIHTVTLPISAPGQVGAAALTVVYQERQKLGSAGVGFLSIFAGLALVVLLVRRRIDARVSSSARRLKTEIPEAYRSMIVGIVQVASAVFPGLMLLLLFLLGQAFLALEGPIFTLFIQLCSLWTGVTGLLSLAREFFLGPLVLAPHGQTLYRIVRFFFRYVAIGLAILWGGAVFHFPADVLAFVRFLLALTASGSVFLLSTRKEAVLALFPALPNRLYQRFVTGFRYAYHPILFFTFTIGLLWAAGYHHLAEFLIERIWAVVGVFLGAVFLHHCLIRWIKHRVLPGPFSPETVLAFQQALVAIVTYLVTLSTLLLVLGLMGMLTPTLHLLAAPLLTSGKTEISILVLVQAVLLVLVFFLASRVVRTYLDYQVFPALGLDPGMATAINAFLSYTLGALGFLCGLRTLGLDLQALTIFAGALGIGAGFGLQTLTSNLAAGLTLVFGRTIRRGDVVTVGEMIGTVQEVGMRVTRVRTLDNIEILVPNAHLVESTLTNYTHTSPFIRLHVPVGVSYGADPQHVREVMLAVAQLCPHVEPQPTPEVWFTEFGESSLNFELLVWMNIHQTSRGQVRSALYFALFQAFKAVGIEIPFPQRDLHIRSGVPWQTLGNPEDTTNDPNGQLLSGKDTHGKLDPGTRAR